MNNEPLIFEHSRPGRVNHAQSAHLSGELDDIPEALQRKQPPRLPEVSELDFFQRKGAKTQRSRRRFSDALVPGFLPLWERLQPRSLLQISSAAEVVPSRLGAQGQLESFFAPFASLRLCVGSSNAGTNELTT